MSFKTPQEALTEQIRMMDMRYKMLAGKVELVIEYCREVLAEEGSDDDFINGVCETVIGILEGKQ